MVVKAALSPKQQIFVELVAEGENQRTAYKKAGYSCKSDAVADTDASRLLSNAKVSLALRELRAKLAKKSEWSATRLIKSFEKIFDRSMQEEAVLDHEGNPTGEYRYDSSGANKALENIAKIIGAYQQTDGNTIVINQFLTNVQQKYGIIEAK